MRFFVIATLLIAASASAQQLTGATALEADPNYRRTAEKTFLQYESTLSTHCQQIAPDWSRARQIMYANPVFNEQKQLVSGVWSEIVPGTACGQARNFRALVVIREGRIGLSRQLPGTSNTTPSLERDTLVAMMGAVQAHRRQDRLEPPIDVLDTELLGPTLPAAHQSWKEVWLIRVSGHEMRVPIVFVPDQNGSGTSFHVNPKEITDVPVN